MILTDDSRPSDFTFAHMAVQANSLDGEDPLDFPEELKQTIECHLWLANLEVSAAITASMLRQPSIPRA